MRIGKQYGEPLEIKVTWVPMKQVPSSGEITALKALCERRVRVKTNIETWIFQGFEAEPGPKIEIPKLSEGFIGHTRTAGTVIAFPITRRTTGIKIDGLKHGEFDSILINWITLRDNCEIDR